MEVETVASNCGKNKVVLNGFVYVKQKRLANNITSYECERRTGSGTSASECKAKVKLNEDLSVVSYLNMHTHAADSAHVDVLKVRASIKRKAVETEETPEQILRSQLQGLIQEAAVQMGPICHVRRCIRQVRQKQNAVHPMPLTRSFEIPDELTRLDDGENFLLFDSRAEDVNRILVFGTERTVRLLGESDHSFMDGTFKVVPELFFQLYTIQVLASFYVVIP